MSTSFNHRLLELEEASRRLASADFSAPRFYTSLLLENQAVPVRNAKTYEQSLFTTNPIETMRNLRTRENMDDFESTMELATSLNEICQNEYVYEQLEEISNAHVDVLSSIARLSSRLAELQGSNSANDTQQSGPGWQEGDEIMADVEREEGEIFALEQMLSEKRQLLNQMQQELDGFASLSEMELMQYDSATQEEDPETNTEIAASKLEIEKLNHRIQEQRWQEKELVDMYENLVCESNELLTAQQDAEALAKEDSSPQFEELMRLYEKVTIQEGDTLILPKGVQEAYLKLERLLDGLERCQRHIVMLDVLE
ncbi:hypothetical protein BCR41DRAFT_385103 [Lobosporangium transversale]|uniref:Uncharacterized protein n=1 Tax=Lobosporangium transversale TaxID=64571 RepID=A0A1Y2GTM4_9FUNG|nr:hypothetical protein BCR41DRAFT_385103 [Lobosporangium transversale]ORZ22828.1 hypothetical protein BCR41DRAFT_385103 [Lobosporangium transversale]|eukprot:XP_021883382.1 hypothetical protein BCR41DRAFT_385103 [Lobosporangium transversale]